jgi:hypothetical protein
VYLLRVVAAPQPKENIPLVPFPAADPPFDAALDAVADPLVQQA